MLIIFILEDRRLCNYLLNFELKKIFFFFILTLSVSFDIIEERNVWGRSEAGLSRWPVTPEIAGSSPVAPV